MTAPGGAGQGRFPRWIPRGRGRAGTPKHHLALSQRYQTPRLPPRPRHLDPSPLTGDGVPAGAGRGCGSTVARPAARFCALPHAALRRRTSLYTQKACIYSVWRIPDPHPCPTKTASRPHLYPAFTPPNPHFHPTKTTLEPRLDPPLPLPKPTWTPLGPHLDPTRGHYCEPSGRACKSNRTEI